MTRALALVLVALTLPAAARGEVVAQGADGSTVVAYRAADGIRVSVDLGPATLVPGSQEAYAGFAVAASPPRVIWMRRFADLDTPYARRLYQPVVSRPGGEPQPLAPAKPSTATIGTVTAAAPDGTMLAVVDASDGSGTAVLSDAGGPFAPIGGPAPGAFAVPAVASGGRALLVGREGDHYVMRERAPGQAFGPAETVTGPNLVTVSPAIAADGSALLLTADNGGLWSVRQRAAPGPFGPAQPLGSGLPTPGGVAAAPGARGVAVFADTTTSYTVSAIDGGAVTTRRYPDASGPSATFPVAMRDDGSAAVALGRRVAVRGPTGGFADASDLGVGLTHSVALGPAGLLVAGSTFENGVTLTRARLGNHVSVLDSQYFFSAPPPPARVSVAPGDVRVRRGHALVPVLCRPVGGPCTGRVGHVRFSIGEGFGAYVRIPVRRDAKRLVARVRTRKTTVIRRRLRRGPDRRACRVAPWARTLAGRGARRLAAVQAPSLYADDESASHSTRVLVCRPGHRPRLVTRTQGDVLAGDRAGATVALATLRTGVVLERFEPSRDPELLGPSDFVPPYGVEALRVAPDGSVALADRLDGHVRIRIVDAMGDRIADRAPGIDPASLRLHGSIATWSRDGVQQSAPLA